MKIKTNIEIKAPIEKVFDLFTDLESIRKHISGIIKYELLEGSAKMQVGTKWKETREVFGKEADEVMWVTSLEYNRSYVVEADSHGTHYRSEYIFESTPNSTIVSFEFSGKPYKLGSKIMSIMAFLFAGSLKKMMHQDMVDLKTAAESVSNL